MVACRYRPNSRQEYRTEKRTKRITASSPTVVKMEEENGVYYIPVTINDVPMKFIFDTGASVISISETELVFFFKHGLLKEEDFLGNSSFQDANGTVSENKMVNLRTVKIGDKVLENVTASIVPNQKAPLLLGQSALAKFWKISIDNKRKELALE